jgi:hypothetical protein
MLFHLIADLSRDPALRERFDREPEVVLDEYEVLEHEPRAAMLNRDVAEVQRLAVDEQQDVLGKLIPSRRFMWPGNEIDVQEVAPSACRRDEAVELTIRGELFDPSAAVEFICDGETVHGEDVNVESHGLSSTIVVRGHFSRSGRYDVRVVNPGGEHATVAHALSVA